MVNVDIDIRTRLVSEIDTEHAVTLALSGGAKVRIESSFELAGPGFAPKMIDPENLGSDRALQETLGGRIVEDATADRDTGVLVISFDGGVQLKVPSDPHFESWSASWPDGSTVVALPGGGLSCWGAQQ